MREIFNNLNFRKFQHYPPSITFARVASWKLYFPAKEVETKGGGLQPDGDATLKVSYPFPHHMVTQKYHT